MFLPNILAQLSCTSDHTPTSLTFVHELVCCWWPSSNSWPTKHVYTRWEAKVFPDPETVALSTEGMGLSQVSTGNGRMSVYYRPITETCNYGEGKRKDINDHSNWCISNNSILLEVEECLIIHKPFTFRSEGPFQACNQLLQREGVGIMFPSKLQNWL